MGLNVYMIYRFVTITAREWEDRPEDVDLGTCLPVTQQIEMDV